MPDTAQITLYLPADLAAGLERLQALREDPTLEETIVAGLSLYGVEEANGFLRLSDSLRPDID